MKNKDNSQKKLKQEQTTKHLNLENLEGQVKRSLNSLHKTMSGKEKIMQNIYQNDETNDKR